jgi:uncharacterized protein (DUF2267 family)
VALPEGSAASRRGGGHRAVTVGRAIGNQLGDDNRRHAYLALRGTFHAVHDFLPTEDSADLSAQLPMLVQGIYFEDWNPTNTPEKDRSRESFLGRTEHALEWALWNEDHWIDTKKAARAVMRVLSDRISSGEVEQVRHVLPEPVRELWPEPVSTR